MDSAKPTAEPFNTQHRPSLGAEQMPELLLGPRRGDELAPCHDVHGNVLARQSRVVRRGVPILAVRRHHRQLLERLTDLVALRAASFLYRLEQEQGRTVAVLRE